MNKPDWATRLQRTFKRKYDKGYAEGHLKGWNAGFEVGSKKAVAEAKKVFIKRLEKEIKDNKDNLSPGAVAGLHAAISIIRRNK